MTNPKNRAAKPRRPFAVILCCSLFLALTAAFFLPLEVVLLNQKEFLFPFGTVWAFQLLIAVIGALVLTGLMALLPAKAGRIGAALALGGGIALWAQSMFMNGGMVSLTGAEMNVSTAGKILNLAAWILLIAAPVALAIVFGRKDRKKTETAMCLVAGALVVMQAVALGSLAAASDDAERKADHFLSTEGEFTLSGGNNVIEFVLDTADETYFNQMLERYPEMKEELSGWLYYRNTSSTYSRTYPSVPYLLTGEKCWFDREYAQYVQEAYDGSDYLKRLHDAGTDVRIFTLNPTLVAGKPGETIGNLAEYDYARFDNLDLVNLEKNLAHISLYKGSPYVMKNRFGYYVEWVNASSFREMQETAFTHKTEPDFCGALRAQGLSVSEDYPQAYRFYHLWGTHPGFRWNDRLESADGTDPVAALRGSFLMIGEYVRRMQELGVYDSATILVTADHGFSGGGDTLDVPEAATPLILVKYPDSDGTQLLTTDAAPVAHEDLFATVETALGLPASGTGSGKTLRDFTEGEDRTRLYYYSALYSDMDGEVALREYEIHGDANDLNNWHATGNWWNIDYSMNMVSPKRFTEE